jgi:hypothetical protein
MKNVKNVIKGLLIGCVVIAGCFVSSGTAIAQENTVDTDMVNVVSHYTDSKGNCITNYKDGSFYVNSE